MNPPFRFTISALITHCPLLSAFNTRKALRSRRRRAHSKARPLPIACFLPSHPLCVWRAFSWFRLPHWHEKKHSPLPVAQCHGCGLACVHSTLLIALPSYFVRETRAIANVGEADRYEYFSSAVFEFGFYDAQSHSLSRPLLVPVCPNVPIDTHVQKRYGRLSSHREFRVESFVKKIGAVLFCSLLLSLPNPEPLYREQRTWHSREAFALNREFPV